MMLSVKLFLTANVFAVLSSAYDTNMVAKKASGRSVRANNNRHLQAVKTQNKKGRKKGKAVPEKKEPRPDGYNNDNPNSEPPPQYGNPSVDSNVNYIGAPYGYPDAGFPDVQNGYPPYPENQYNGNPETQYNGYPESQYRDPGNGFNSNPVNEFYGNPGNGINGIPEYGNPSNIFYGNPETAQNANQVNEYNGYPGNGINGNTEYGNPSNVVYGNPETTQNVNQVYREVGSEVDSENGAIIYPDNQGVIDPDNPNTFSENTNEDSTTENITPEYPVYENPSNEFPQTENTDNGSNELEYPTWEDLFALSNPVMSPTIMPTRKATTSNFNQFRVSQSTSISSASPSSSMFQLFYSSNVTPSPTASPKPNNMRSRPPNIRQIRRHKTSRPILQ